MRKYSKDLFGLPEQAAGGWASRGVKKDQPYFKEYAGGGYRQDGKKNVFGKAGGI